MLNVALRSVGRAVLGALADTGVLWRLARSTFDHVLVAPFQGEPLRLRSIAFQAVRAGNRSLPLVAVISLLIGMIVALQSAYQLRKLGAVHLVASLVAITITRELAPLLTAIIVAGRFGSAIAAEIGTMKVSQEIDALEVMGIDPVSFLVVPRFLALAISLPCLTIFSDLVGILGGLVVAAPVLGLGATGYLFDSLNSLRMEDIVTGLVKALAFSAIIGLVGCQQGLGTRGGAEEVGRATTTSVVRSIFLMIGADLFVTALFYLRG